MRFQAGDKLPEPLIKSLRDWEAILHSPPARELVGQFAGERGVIPVESERTLLKKQHDYLMQGALFALRCLDEEMYNDACEVLREMHQSLKEKPKCIEGGRR